MFDVFDDYDKFNDDVDHYDQEIDECFDEIDDLENEEDMLDDDSYEEQEIARDSVTSIRWLM